MKTIKKSHVLLLCDLLDDLLVLVFVLVDQRPDVLVLQPHLLLVPLDQTVQRLDLLEDGGHLDAKA